MTSETAEKIYSDILNTSLKNLRDDLIERAVRYARIRTDYAMADLEGKASMEDMRSKSHDSFIDSCNILSRNMANKGEDISWREQLGGDRKTIGDFACHIHCILGIRAR